MMKVSQDKRSVACGNHVQLKRNAHIIQIHCKTGAEQGVHNASNVTVAKPFNTTDVSESSHTFLKERTDAIPFISDIR
jgi:hypothetical protein